MSYLVEYNPELTKKYPTVVKSKKGLSMFSILLLCIAVVGAFCLAQSGLLRYFIPGDPDVTASAFSELLNQIQAGEPIKTSVLSFCEEIIVQAS